MPIVLHKTDASPPVRAVLMTVDIIGLKIDTQNVNTVAGDQHKPEFLKKNPLHTIPLLEDGDFILADSHAIITYLVSKYGAEKRSQLYPSDLRTRALVDQRLFFDNSILFPKLRSVVIEILKHKSPGATAEQREEIEEAYGFLEKYLEVTPYLVGDHVTLADISCVASVSTLDVFVSVDEKYVKVHEWWSRLKEEEWYQRANEPGLALFAGFLKQAMENNAS